MKRVLVTGVYGFLGRHTAALFKQQGCEVVGIGHGHWGFEKPEEFGIDEWIEADVDQAGLSYVTGSIDCVIHCAGGSSVGHSVTHPLREFQRTVNSTVNVLEFIRTKHPSAKLIYPSSAAVYGDQQDIPLAEDCASSPISPYGFYKKIVEGLCESYAVNFDISVAVIRFFSIYGPGLKKQLLWDACAKFYTGDKCARFYGTGDETRDWLHVKDAAQLVYLLTERDQNGFKLYNGGSGQRTTVREILSIIAREMGESEVIMGNEDRPGDPKHYWADISRALDLGWAPLIDIYDGLREYVHWYKAHQRICAQ